MRILFFATYPTQPTGYGRIGNILTNHLASVGHEVYYLGISHFKDSAIERDVHPFIHLIDALAERKEGSEELYGVDVICDTIHKVRPDVVLIYNDVIVINRILNEFINTNIEKNFKLCIYLDMVYEYQRLLYFQNINLWADSILVFSECWKKNLITMGLTENKIDVLPHGFDDTIFKPIAIENATSTATAIAKQSMGFAPDDFVILNSNRNAYRKAHDITIEAFVKFLKKQNYNPSIKLFLNMQLLSPQGYNIHELIKVICLKNEVDHNEVVLNHVFIRPSDLYFPDEKLNMLYNACDVGINTCLGEGFGLCNLEHACIGKPQIISKVGALADIFTNNYATLIEPKTDLYLASLTEGHEGYIKITDSSDFAEALDKYYSNRDLARYHGGLAQSVLTKKYEWKHILEGLNQKLVTLTA